LALRPPDPAAAVVAAAAAAEEEEKEEEEAVEKDVEEPVRPTRTGRTGGGIFVGADTGLAPPSGGANTSLATARTRPLHRALVPRAGVSRPTSSSAAIPTSSVARFPANPSPSDASVP